MSGRTPIGMLLDMLVPMDTVTDRGVQPATLVGYGPISAAHVRLLRPTASVRPVYVDSRSGQPIALGDQIHTPQAEQAEQGATRQGRRQSKDTRRRQQRPATDTGTGTGKGAGTGGNGLYGSRPAAWDEASFRMVIQGFLQPVEVTDTAEPQHDPSARLTRLLQVRDVRCAGPGCSVPARRCERDHLIPYGQPGGVPAAWNLLHLSRRCHRAKHHGWSVAVDPDGRVTWVSPLGRTDRKPSPHDRPEATDWARWEGSARWGFTGLQLFAPPAPVHHQAGHQQRRARASGERRGGRLGLGPRPRSLASEPDDRRPDDGNDPGPRYGTRAGEPSEPGPDQPPF